MPRKAPPSPVSMSFEESGVRLAIADIQPLKLVTEAIKKSPKYTQIAASMREVGIIEPPVVSRDRTTPGKYLLLDGHLRIELLKELGEQEVVCLVSTDDEAFTYNKRVNRLAIIQEHRMILKAIERGASEERIAKTLNINIGTLKNKVRMLEGICAEVVELLRDKHPPISTFSVLRKMAPLRQIESAELMVAMNKYTLGYARSLLAATPQSQLVEPHKPKRVRGLTDDQMALMEKESASLEREFKVVEQSYGADHLDLVLTKGYLAKILANARIVRYLAQNHQELLTELQRITDMKTLAA
jgi:RepB plasmid partitioning protein/ParB/Sulfiredoxin domain